MGPRSTTCIEIKDDGVRSTGNIKRSTSPNREMADLPGNSRSSAARVGQPGAPADVRSFFKSWLAGTTADRSKLTANGSEGFRERLAAGDERATLVMRPTFEFATDDQVLNIVANKVLATFFDALNHLTQLSEEDLSAIMLGTGGDDETELASVWCDSLLDSWMVLLADLLHSAGEDPIRYLTQLKLSAQLER